MSDSEAKAMLGMEILIADRQARFGRKACSSAASYAVARQRVAEFLLGFRITSRQLPLPGETVRTLDVQCRGAFFDQLSLLENGCALYVRDGRFFTATKRPAGVATDGSVGARDACSTLK
jgi:hypothetical protein